MFLSDLIPLRDTSAWPGYDRLVIIPRIYGKTRITPIRYQEAGALFVVADHPIAGVDSVTLNGDRVDFRTFNGVDWNGHAVAFLELATAPDTGAVLTADVRGLSGNPADIVNDLYPRDDLADFRTYCANAGLELGGALDSKMTIRAAISMVLDQVGTVWSAGLPGFAWEFPPPPGDPIQGRFSGLSFATWTAECSLDTLVTRLVVPFDWDYSAQLARQSIQVEAPTQVAIHGMREREFPLPWVKTARQALAIADRFLRWNARPVWTLKCSAGLEHRALLPAGWITVDHPQLPLRGDYVVTDLDPGYGSGTVSITALAAAGLEPTPVLVRQSAQFEPIRTDFVIDPAGDWVTLTITDSVGKRLPGARVWIDGHGPLVADANAQIRFRAGHGTHVLRIEATGMTAITTSITL